MSTGDLARGSIPPPAENGFVSPKIPKERWLRVDWFFNPCEHDGGNASKNVARGIRDCLNTKC